MLRVPFVRACSLLVVGQSRSAMIVNINVLGAYLASDEIPDVGTDVAIAFQVPGNEIETEIRGQVAWINPVQQHLVHSLPPGFGMRFVGLPDPARARIEIIVGEYA
ncbi:MAG: PilZ domain-containing protein, partial [Thermoplasmata archaeon]|nr:PilZ domain-containing protein [Thermoplasmata archaeon]